MFMKWAAGDQAGTDFTLLQCAVSCGGIALSSISGAIAGRWGITAAFLGASLVGLLAIAVVLGPARVLARNPIGGSSRPVEAPSDEIRDASVDAST
jgi:PAT family beta-lactamase induction signal transducer AmpG